MGITIKQIAQEVGLSWPAVSQILNERGRFAPETRKRVIAAAKKHGYRPNSSARALRGQSSKLVGVLFRNDASEPLTNMAGFEYLLGINQSFQAADLGTLVIRAGEIAEAGDREPRVFRERLVDGVIVVSSLPQPLIERVKTLSQRIIWLDTEVWTETCCIRRDEFGAGYKCAQVLTELGYKKLIFLTRDAQRAGMHHSHIQREAGSRAAAVKFGAAIETVPWPEFDVGEEYRILTTAIKGDVGIIVGSLPIARRLVHSSGSIGRSPGVDYAMVCCDDSFDTQSNWRGLSRMEFHRYALGERAAEMMLSLLSNPASPPPSVIYPNSWHAGCTAWAPRAG